MTVIHTAPGRLAGFLRGFLRGFGRTDPEELLQAARVSLWVRWFGLAFCLAEVNYRVDYGALSHILNNCYVLWWIAANGYVYYLVRRRGEAKPVLLLGLSAMDLAGISFSTSLSGGFNSPYFPLYYFAVGMFAWVFTSPRLALPWTTLVVAVYSVLSVTIEPGLDIAEREERNLAYRVVALYLVSTAVSLITGFERDRRRRGQERERELQRERIELSQAIHDTVGQSVYVVALGVETARDLAVEAGAGLAARLEAIHGLARTAMWELRHPIDSGQIFEGRGLSEALETHAASFTAITSLPVEVVQEGEEPELPPLVSGRLFAIAHNAMTNVLRHAQASRVEVVLDFRADGLCLSVSDDGIGMPRERDGWGHGLRNMAASAELMGGRLEVSPGPDGAGVRVTCVLPYPVNPGGERSVNESAGQGDAGRRQ